MSADSQGFRARVIRVLEGTASEEERSEVSQWRSRSIENDLHYRELAAIWNAAGELMADGNRNRTTRSERPTADQVLGRGILAAPDDALQAGRPRRRPAWGVRAAAAAIALLLLGMWVHSWSTQPLYAVELVTGPDELITRTLLDGTVVRLAPSSRLLVRRDDPTRTVWLDGRAFFAVREVEGERFVVRTRLGDATVLGTRFSVSARGGEMELAVLQGAVQVTSTEGSARVEGGQLGRLHRGRAPVVQGAENMPALFTWMGSFLAFADTPLPQAVAEIRSLYGVDVVIADTALERRVITGWFSQEDGVGVMDVVCRIVGASCTTTDQAVVMTESRSAR
jgi:transmembrane sensor